MCDSYRPDHNGECTNCDEPLDGHDEAAVDNGIVDAFLAGYVPADTAAERVARIRRRFDEKLRARQEREDDA